MPRQTAAQIEAYVVDRAAALFARHGTGRTSLQQIADAGGYTKAGLLHHFPSKQAIYEAVAHAVNEQIAGLASVVHGVSPGLERDRAIVTSLVSLTERWPGVSEFMTTLVRDNPEASPELERAGLAVLQVFAVDLESPDEKRLIRIAGAASALTTTVLLAIRADLTREWRAAIVDMAMNTLGHQTTTSR